MTTQANNEAADTDAEIERIKSEIEIEQKSKQTLGRAPPSPCTLCRVDQHGAGAECPDDGEECDGDGGGQP
jgi:hypothetical protein